MTVPIAISIIAVLVAIAALAWNVGTKHSDLRRADLEKYHTDDQRQHEELVDEIQRLELRIRSLEVEQGRTDVKLEVFWREVGVASAKILRSNPHPKPEHARRDELIDRYTAGTITPEELGEFIALLRRVVNDRQIDKLERYAADRVLGALRRQYPLLSL